jgi:hypothetical protein
LRRRAYIGTCRTSSFSWFLTQLLERILLSSKISRWAGALVAAMIGFLLVSSGAGVAQAQTLAHSGDHGPAAGRSGRHLGQRDI